MSRGVWVCVCVWTIWKDVKLPLFWWWLFFVVFAFELYLQGGSESHSIHCPTKTVVWDCDIGTDHPDVPAISNFQFIVHGYRLSQEPACRFQLHQDLPQNFCVNRFQYTVRFSQSEFLPFSSDGTVAFCKDKERNHLYWFFLPCHPTLACQTLGGCLCTPDALHNSNSVRYFWASVSFLLFTSSWQEPFGESLSRLTIDSKTMSEFTLLN